MVGENGTRVVLGRVPGKAWGEEGVKKKSLEKGGKKSVCFTKPDLQQNCHFLKLHKVF